MTRTQLVQLGFKILCAQFLEHGKESGLKAGAWIQTQKLAGESDGDICIRYALESLAVNA